MIIEILIGLGIMYLTLYYLYVIAGLISYTLPIYGSKKRFLLDLIPFRAWVLRIIFIYKQLK